MSDEHSQFANPERASHRVLTDEQERVVWNAMNATGMGCHRGQVMLGVVPLVWDMAVDEALEAAALECDAVVDNSGSRGACEAGGRIRALKVRP